MQRPMFGAGLASAATVLLVSCFVSSGQAGPLFSAPLPSVASSLPIAQVDFADLDGGLPDMLSQSGATVVMRSNLGSMNFGPEYTWPVPGAGTLEAGVYLLRFEAAGRIVTRRFSVVR